MNHQERSALRSMERGIAKRFEYASRLEELVKAAHPNFRGACAHCQGSGFDYSQDYNAKSEWDKSPCPQCKGAGLLWEAP